LLYGDDSLRHGWFLQVHLSGNPRKYSTGVYTLFRNFNVNLSAQDEGSNIVERPKNTAKYFTN
jgi:hypothetical protein